MFASIPVNQVPVNLRLNKKRKVFVTVTETVNVPMDAGLWSGGSRDQFMTLDTSNGRTTAAVSFEGSSPFGGRPQGDTRIALMPGLSVVKVGSFCGKEATPHYFVHPADKHLFGL